MARLVKHDANGPMQIKKDEMEKDSIWLCRCGLSDNQPYCDGSHKQTRDEEDDCVYVYDEDGRVKVS